MQQNKNQEQIIQEDEIDLRELFKTIWLYKKFILIFTFCVTVASIVFFLVKTPIYEVKSTVEIGKISNELIDKSSSLVKRLRIVFNVDFNHDKNATSVVTNISEVKKIPDFLIISTQSLNNNDAIQKNQKVITYIKEYHKIKIDEYMYKTNVNIKDIEVQLKMLRKISVPNLDKKISVLKTQEFVKLKNKIQRLKTQKLARLDDKIDRLKTQDLVKLNDKIGRLKTQDLVKLNDKIGRLKTQELTKIKDRIKFLNKSTIPSIQNKIKFQEDKLKEYTTNISNIYSNKNKELDLVSSVQIVNYQNLILNVQNRIEDLKVKITDIQEKTLKDLEIQKKNLIDVTLRGLEIQKKNLIDVTLRDLEIQKKNLIDITLNELYNQKENLVNVTLYNLEFEEKNLIEIKLKKLENTKNFTLKEKERKLLEEIDLLKFKLSNANLINSRRVGEFAVNDYPIKPKKKLIVIVAFVTGLILAVFLVFFIQFIKNGRNEEETQSSN